MQRARRRALRWSARHRRHRHRPDHRRRRAAHPAVTGGQGRGAGAPARTHADDAHRRGLQPISRRSPPWLPQTGRGRRHQGPCAGITPLITWWPWSWSSRARRGAPLLRSCSKALRHRAARNPDVRRRLRSQTTLPGQDNGHVVPCRDSDRRRRPCWPYPAIFGARLLIGGTMPSRRYSCPAMAYLVRDCPAPTRPAPA